MDSFYGPLVGFVLHDNWQGAQKDFLHREATLYDAISKSSASMPTSAR
jgi:hypothetical protein